MDAESFFLDPSLRDEVERGERLFCPHCSSYLTKKAFLSHERLYFDLSSQQWLKRSKPDAANSQHFWDLDAEWSEDRQDINQSRDGDDLPHIPDFTSATDFSDLTTEAGIGEQHCLSNFYVMYFMLCIFIMMHR